MEKPFLAENFLLSTPTSEKLYFEFAQPLPLFDYHCHIPPAEIAGNKRFENLTQIWLAGGPLQMAGHARQRCARAFYHR
jgi:glucuronate isomerase